MTKTKVDLKIAELEAKLSVLIKVTKQLLVVLPEQQRLMLLKELDK